MTDASARRPHLGLPFTALALSGPLRDELAALVERLEAL